MPSVVRVVAATLCAFLSGGCVGPTAPGPSFEDAEVRILFVGNSLTYANDLPGVVGTVADVAGGSVSTLAITAGGYAIEDHWAEGLDARIRDLKPDVVVLQQGPSSLPESRANLVEWTDSVARVARGVGAEVALLMVWPELARYGVFDQVHASYRDAADAVGGTFIPAGDAFRALHDAHPELEPYGPDAFHPSQAGTLVSAMVVVRALLHVRVTGLPAVMRPSRPDLPVVTLTADEALALQQAADGAVDALAMGPARSPLGGALARRPFPPALLPREAGAPQVGLVPVIYFGVRNPCSES